MFEEDFKDQVVYSTKQQQNYKIASVNRISDEIRRRRWNWIGHVLRGDKSSDCMVALGWQPEGKRAVGRPKTTWRRTVETERRKAVWCDWGTARATA